MPIKVCPANIFAKSRIDKLNGRIQKEKISIKIIKSNKIFGTPFGLNKLKKRRPWFKKPKKNKLINMPKAK